MKTKLLVTTLGIFALFIGLVMINGFSTTDSQKPWPVPDKYLKMANPVVSNPESIKDGKGLWVTHCQSCHGKSGKGDGSKAAQLKTETGDLSLAASQKQSDGSFFYKISEGRDDMPNFKKKLPDTEDIWSLVNYMRTLKK